MSDETLAYGRGKIIEYGIVDPGDAKKTGLGTMTDARWKNFFDLMAADGLYPKDMDYRLAFTTTFVNHAVENGGAR